MAEQRQTASELDRFKTIGRGLGGLRYKEYDIAPYCEMVQAFIPEEVWSGVFYSWSSLKGHLQGLHGLEGTEMYAGREEEGEGRIYACFFTIWSSGDALAEWIEHGYPVEKMLKSLGVPEESIEMRLIRDYS